MPFTVSHAAAILPIRARWLSTSALVIGAMTPDLPLFAPFLPFTTEATHTVFATLVTNTAIGFVLFVIWHGFLARPADWFALSAIRKRLTPVQQPGLRARLSSSGKVLVSLMIGGLTHQILDWFTTRERRSPTVSRCSTSTSQVCRCTSSCRSRCPWSVSYFWRIGQSVGSPGLRFARCSDSLQRWGRSLRGTVLGAAVGATGATAWGLYRVGSSSDTLVFAVSVTPVVAIAVASAVIAVLWHVNPRREVVLTHEGDVVGQSDDRNPQQRRPRQLSTALDRRPPPRTGEDAP